MGTRETKERIALRDGWNCHYCGRDLLNLHKIEGSAESFKFQPDYPQLDHVVPRKNGGSGKDGYVLACKRCNSQKGARPYEQFKNRTDR